MAQEAPKQPKSAQKPPERVSIPPRPDPRTTPLTIRGNYPANAATKEATEHPRQG